MSPSLNYIVLVITLCVSQIASAEEKQQESVEEAKPFLTVKLVDQQGKPVEGARASISSVINGYDRERGVGWEFVGPEVRSDSEGLVRISNPAQFDCMVFARHAGRNLVATKRTDLIEDQKSPLILTMYPECHVTWKIKCSQLDQIGKDAGQARGRCYSGDQICQKCFQTGLTLHFFLPPGEFRLMSYGKRFCPVDKKIVVKTGQIEFDAGTTDAYARKWILLEGKPAPEIIDVQGWKNGPIKLSQLRGKVVILEFWGWWCGPCIYYGIPELFKLQKEYPAEDLAIIGVHTPYGEEDQVTSIKELNEKLSKIQKDVWKGKQINFPVALTRFRKLPYSPGEESYANSRMSVEYGILSFPSVIVIDRQGNIFGSLNLQEKADRDKLKQLIEAK
ncbi:TlpA family protein disulfide reductase [Gimesia sp.]|uniref:TlpA family protein disulfide reductase n=1 Tax=Gimesia sp. TaxID=2024833 RepID=UPI003A91ABF9